MRSTKTDILPAQHPFTIMVFHLDSLFDIPSNSPGVQEPKTRKDR
jgi:hypothetical protein